MASTKLSDIVDPQVLADQVSALFPGRIQLEACGAVLAETNGDIASGGTRITIPRWKRGGDMEPLSDSAPLGIEKVDSVTEQGVVVRRGKAFGVHDFARLVSLDDPQTEIARQIAAIFARHLDSTLIHVLEGAIPPANRRNVAVTSGSAMRIGKSSVLDAMFALGDNESDLTAAVMHSKVFKDAYDQGLIVYSDVPADAVNPGVRSGLKATIFGRPVYVSDRVPVDTTVPDYFAYTTFFLGSRALYLGYQRELTIETDRDVLTKEDIISFDAHFVPHLFGVGWTDAANNPGNDALADPDNWDLKAEDARSVRAVAMVTN
ncbi:MAG: hypothetical protein KIT79_06980 [Deltaproteobacteria bacterium]|nr:hypothetical protein [Deltaproteobacteria bacterium]